MTANLETAFAELDKFEDRIPAETLRRWISECTLQLEDVGEYCRFHPNHYVRNLVHAGPAFHALVLCWRNGQRSQIHDHRGSGCAVKILAGEAIETQFETAPNGMVYAVSSRVLGKNATCYSEDADMHQVSNLQAASTDLVTLHIYSPPLLSMNVYSLEGRDVRDFTDPVNYEFTFGGGIYLRRRILSSANDRLASAEDWIRTRSFSQSHPH